MPKPSDIDTAADAERAIREAPSPRMITARAWAVRVLDSPLPFLLLALGLLVFLWVGLVWEPQP